MLRSLLPLLLLLVAALLVFDTVHAASVKSMVASQQTSKLGLRDKDLLTYVGNLPEDIRSMMLRMRFRR